MWLTLTLMLVVALQFFAATEAFGDAEQTAANPVTDFPLVGAEPSAEELPSVVYAGQLWSLVDARATSAEGLLQRAAVEVDVTVTNTLSITPVRIPDSSVTLVHHNGDVVGEGRFVDAGARLSLDPGESIDVTVAFVIGFSQTPDLGELSLVIGEAHRIPASLTLAGPQPEPVYPVFAAVDSNGQTLVDPNAADRQIVIEPSAAAVDINAGPYRASVGEELVVVKVIVQRTDTSDDALYLDVDYWALATADGEYGAILVAPTARPSSNADEVTLLFAFPEGSDELSLVAAANADTNASFSIVLPN